MMERLGRTCTADVIRNGPRTRPRVLPIRPEPDQTVRLAVPFCCDPITVVIARYAGRSGVEGESSTVVRTADGCEVVVTLLLGGVPIRVRDVDRARGTAPAVES